MSLLHGESRHIALFSDRPSLLLGRNSRLPPVVHWVHLTLWWLSPSPLLPQDNARYESFWQTPVVHYGNLFELPLLCQV